MFREGPPEPLGMSKSGLDVRLGTRPKCLLSFLPFPWNSAQRVIKRVNLGLVPAPILFSSPSENQRYINWPLEGSRRLPFMAGR